MKADDAVECPSSRIACRRRQGAAEAPLGIQLAHYLADHADAQIRDIMPPWAGELSWFIADTARWKICQL